MDANAVASPPVVAWIDQARSQGLGAEVIGGKAAGLAALAAVGLPVPAAFVVLPTAFVPGLALSSRPGLAPGAADGIAAAYRLLAVNGADPAVAVRSSANVEDGALASHAGQFKTILGVRGAEGVIAAALDCAESLHAVNAVAYRHGRLGEDEATAPRMAVVVQRMVAPDAAGVAFTVDPISGDRGSVVVNAARGLGTAVVDGTAAADRAWIDRDTLAVTREAPGDGAEMSIRRATASVIARLALAAEAAIGVPADVEWASRDGAVWLLQARPVTGLPPGEVVAADANSPRGSSLAFPFDWPEAADAARHWRRDGRPGEAPATPWDEIERASFGRAHEASGATVGRAGARRFITLNGMRYSTDAVDPVPAHVRDAQRRTFEAAVLAVQASDRTYWEAALEPEIILGNRRLDAILPETLDGPGLAAYFADVLAWHERLWVLHLHVLHTVRFGPHTFRAQLQALLESHSGPAAVAEIDGILSHVATLTSESVEALSGLARMVRDTPSCAARMLAWPPVDGADEAREVVAFREAFGRLLDTYSLRADAGAFTIGRSCQPGWRDRPDLPIALVSRYAAQDLDGLGTRKAAAVAARDEVVAGLRGSLPDDASRASFDRLLGLARREVAAYENHNHAIDASASALLWRARDAVARALHGRGVIADPADAIWLTRAEIEAALRADPAEAVAKSWADLVAGRRAVHRWQSALAAPDWLGVPPAPGAATGSPLVSTQSPATPTEPPPDALVVGQPGARGRATGRVRHVPPDAEVPEVEPGDVLVARNAGALWSPVLPLAAAVVLEEGALLQHAMLICREFAVPGIVQAKGALSRLAEGTAVTVDGTRGWVVAADPAGPVGPD